MWIQVQALPLTSCVTSGREQTSQDCSFLICSTGITVPSQRVVEEVKLIKIVKGLQQQTLTKCELFFFWLLYESTCLNLGNTVILTENGNINSLKESQCQDHCNAKAHLALLHFPLLWLLDTNILIFFFLQTASLW